MANNDLQLEYGVKFDVKTGGANATAEIKALSDSWQALLDKQKLVIKMGAEAEKYSMGNTTGDQAQSSVAESDRNKQAKQLKELSAYYKELSDRARDFYNANQSDKNAALDGMKKRLEQIKKEMADIEYNLIGITDKKKPRADTTLQLNWIEDLKKEAAGIQAAMASLSNLNMGGTPANVQKLNSELTTTNFTLLQMREYYKQVEAENAKLAKNALSKTNTKDVLGMKEGSIDEIEKKIQRLNQSMQIFSNTASKVGMNDEKLNGAFRTANEELNRLTQKLATLRSGFGNRSLDSLLQINPKSIQEANVLMAELARRRDALNRTDPGYANSISSINKKQAELSAENARALGISEQKTKAINNETAAFDKQSTVISNLRNMAATYISLYEAGRLVKSIAEVTGQFELQEKSLAAIIQSADKASELFSQVKSLAVVSPFKFGDLLSYTKQLAAYRIETDTLYDTMKNLADVSAGLGVDMSRIILAYGQVSAASVLRGQELRQFTEAGIPLVALLADKFTELEGRVVSTGEVFGKISERMVSFEMVKDIFADMSSEGGMFYNMQEIQADTLAGKISNLTDAYQIMFASIGGDGVVNDILKGSIDLVTKLARNWKDVVSVVAPLSVGLLSYKAVLLGISAVQSAQAGIYAKNIAAQQISIAQNDKEAISLARKTAFQEASLVANKARIADETIMAMLSARGIAMDKQKIVSETIRLAIMRAGTNATKVANLQAEISALLTAQGIAKDRAAALARIGLAVATNTATASNVTFMSTLKAMFALTPGGIFVLIASVIAAIGFAAWNANKEAKALNKELTNLSTAGSNESAQLSGRFKTLSETARDSTKSLKEQNDALSTLKQVYGDILPDYMLTIEGLTEIGNNYDKVTAAIYANIAAKTKEKKISAISDNYEEKVNPVIDGLKTDLGDLGIETMLASKAVDELIKRIGEGTVTSKSNSLELMKILNEINGTEFKIDGGLFQSKNLFEISKGTNKLTDAILYQKQAVEDLNKVPTTFYGNFAEQASKIEDKVKKATENIIKGQKVEGGKTVYFDESIYQFNQRKADAEREKLVEHIRKTTGLAFETVQAELAKNGGKDLNLNFGVVNWLESAVSRVSTIDTTPVAKKVNDILESVAKSQGVDASQYDKYAYKAQGADGEDSFKQLISSHQQLQEKIAQTKRANSEWATDIKVKSAVAASGYREITKAEYLNGYTNGDKRVKGLNQELEAVERVMAAFGLIDKKDKESKGATVVNPRIAAIEAEIALVEQAKKKYEDLVKAGKSPEQSKAIVNDLYKDQFKLKNAKGEILFKPVFDEKGLIGSLKTAKTEFQKISKTEKQVFSIGLKINESEIKIFTDEMKAALSAIEKEFATNKKRIDLFNTLFETTGDSNLAKKLAESIEGTGTVDLELALNKSFQKSFESLKIDTKPLFDKMGNVDISAAQKEIDKLDPTSETRVQAQKQLDIVKEFKAKELTELFKGLADFDNYEAKRTSILRRATQERLDIASRTDLSTEVKQQLTDSSKTKEKESLSKLTTEQFKGSELWQTVFGDLDKVSVDSINLLKDRIKEYINVAGKDLAPTEMKEMMKTLEDLQNRTTSFDLAAVFKAAFTAIDLQPLKDKVEEAKANVDTLRSIKDGLTVGSTVANDKVLAMQKSGEDKSNPEAYQQALDEQASAANALAVANKNLAASEKYLTKAEKDFTTAANSKKKTLKENEAALNKEIEGMKKVKSAVDNTISAFYSMADAVGLAIDPETKEIIDGITKGLGAVIAVLVAVNSVLVVLEGELGVILLEIWPLLVAFALLMAAISIFKAVKLNSINKELEKQQAIVKKLEKEYAELERTMQKSLGTDWVKAYHQELLNLDKTVTSLTKQIELEKSKGKDADQGKIDEMEKSIDDTNQKIVDSSARLQNFISGTELVSAASDFATAWLDAYKSFGSTTDAMKSKFKDMINNMVVNTLLAKAMEVALKPIFTAMEAAADDNVYTPEEIAKIAAETTKSTANADANLTLLMDGLKQAGVDVRDSSTNLTGLSKGISGITEDTALLLGGYLDSIRFRIFAYFDAMAAMPTFDMKSSMATLMTAQNTQISHLEGIKSNTLRSAIASENLSAKIDSVFAVSTAGTGYALRVNA